jgi:hypothetical protein
MDISKKLHDLKDKGSLVKITFSLYGNDCVGKIEDIAENHVLFKTQDGVKTDFWIGAIEKVELLDKEKTK